MAKEITILVKYTGTVPDDVDIADIEEQMDNNLENSLRLNFPRSNEEDYDLKEPWIDREDIYFAENGFQLLIH
ncbi:hypothetical protein EVA_02406 [gut metagenome]|uniref:Uncharacterized protein n=1 Tax=gut metagenome TaxID=749906 RepID=J9H181_9ZZZZ